jgi:thiamine-monophosphate kinase
MSAEDHCSDEPTRLENTIMAIFSSQTPNYRARAAAPASQVRLTAGADTQDDCAVFSFHGNQQLVVGSDYVRGPKFRLYEYGLLTEYDLGYYLAAANISDVAAMGAHPIGLLSVIRYPPAMTDFVFKQVVLGIHDACETFGAPNVGGDIGGAERLILSATALGVCRPGGALLRSGAKAGELVCLTGPTGTAGAATAYFRARDTSDDIETRHREELLASWARPRARTTAGITMGESGVVTSCQDTSDGLKATLECVASASGVGITVFEDRLRIPPPVRAVCRHLRLDPLEVIMGDSVDFELLFTVPPEKQDPLEEMFDEAGAEFHSIGVTTSERGVHLETRSGQRLPLPGKSWRHQQN